MTEAQANLLDWGTTTKGVRCHLTILQGKHSIAILKGKIEKLSRGLGWIINSRDCACRILPCNRVDVRHSGKLEITLRLTGSLLRPANTRAHAALYHARRQQYEQDMEATL